MKGVRLWKCGKCQKWNNVVELACGKCKSEQERWAVAYEYANQLTPQEEQFYTGTAPAILMELRAIRSVIQNSNRREE